MHLAQELLRNVQSSSGSRSFAKEMRAFKMRSGWPLEGDNNQLRAIIKADLTTTREVAKEFNVYYSKIVWQLKHIGKVKKLYKWVPHELTLNQNNICFESVIFSHSM